MPPPHRYINNHFTYVSSCTKYLIFMLNFLFWLFGGLLIGIGLYSGLDKFQATGFVKLDTYYDILLNISIILVLAGGIVFIVSFCGCLGELPEWIFEILRNFNASSLILRISTFTSAGALRENTCLLKFYSLCLLIFFLLEMAVAIIAFIFPHTMNTVLEESFTDRVSHAWIRGGAFIVICHHF